MSFILDVNWPKSTKQLLQRRWHVQENQTKSFLVPMLGLGNKAMLISTRSKMCFFAFRTTTKSPQYFVHKLKKGPYLTLRDSWNAIWFRGSISKPVQHTEDTPTMGRCHSRRGCDWLKTSCCSKGSAVAASTPGKVHICFFATKSSCFISASE